MARRWYIMPMVDNIPIEWNELHEAIKYANGPKYGIRQGMSGKIIYFGDHDYCLVNYDVTPAQHNILDAYTDVIALPTNIDGTPSTAIVTAVQTKIENAGYPADWITTSLTYRQILKRLLSLALVHQRFFGHARIKLKAAGYTLNTQFNELPLIVRQRMIAAAQSQELYTTNLTASSTLREIWNELSSQFAGRYTLPEESL